MAMTPGIKRICDGRTKRMKKTKKNEKKNEREHHEIARRKKSNGRRRSKRKNCGIKQRFSTHSIHTHTHKHTIFNRRF